ncbi:hypothetical protein N8J89_15525 [Crossiella sp. CA-258035]|uniref:hypothetical protein n=1 Tax=Crossiella sp. CA-258035 TaxID=2981138 RepID=UPI0024BD37A2|nr:hypothetical protein [Crossiella sp. CA-258035]WHT22421.1 hypothetical protein N8J89_15525 [Crossiella sp. CA-258035]
MRIPAPRRCWSSGSDSGWAGGCGGRAGDCPTRSGPARAEAIRTGLTAAGGTGAALALLLAVRRQRSTEAALGLQAEAAADQLGSDKARVRLNGLYALARLAEGNADHRQMIVDLICAYLRMPYSPRSGTSHRRPNRRTRRNGRCG